MALVRYVEANDDPLLLVVGENDECLTGTVFISYYRYSGDFGVWHFFDLWPSQLQGSKLYRNKCEQALVSSLNGSNNYWVGIFASLGFKGLGVSRAQVFGVSTTCRPPRGEKWSAQSSPAAYLNTCADPSAQTPATPPAVQRFPLTRARSENWAVQFDSLTTVPFCSMSIKSQIGTNRGAVENP